LAVRNNHKLTGFVERWSRRKLAGEPKLAQSETRGKSSNAQGAGTIARSKANADQFADFDFGSLDFSSDFRRFMSETVPDGVRNRALQILWSSSDIIGRPDELDDYLEDFSEEAMALPAEVAKSAYRIGAGFVGADQGDTPQPDEKIGEIAIDDKTAKHDAEQGPPEDADRRAAAGK
jgi:Protein of unknown function (DUF3306)